MLLSDVAGYAVIVVLTYLIGSIPSGVLLTAVFSKQDIRSKGSGNIGATNVARVAGMRLGLLTLACDLIKGGGPVYLAGIWGPAPAALSMSLAALAAVGGHLFPVYFGFKTGGKGVATAAGCFLVMAPLACLGAVLIFVLVVGVTRRVSGGSLTAAGALPLLVWYATSNGYFSTAAGVISLFVVLRHRQNIVRLLKGEEPPFFGKQDKGDNGRE